MKEVVGQVFRTADANPPIPGCTISKSVYHGENDIIYFSLAVGTDISAEIFPYYKLLIAHEGTLIVYGKHFRYEVRAEEAILTPPGIAVGMQSKTGAVYTEITIRRTDIMNNVIHAGEVFKLAELVPYQDGRIVNMDVVHNDKMKFVIMAFDAGTGLSEHAAPGEAIIFALDGEGIIGYEGKEYPIKAGENFHFAKGGLHAVTAKKQFKMALLLTLD